MANGKWQMGNGKAEIVGSIVLTRKSSSTVSTWNRRCGAEVEAGKRQRIASVAKGGLLESGAVARALQDLAEWRSALSGRGSVVEQRARSFQRRRRFHVKSMAITDYERGIHVPTL